MKLQAFLAKELEIDDKFVSVSIEDVPKEEWESHMQGMQDKVRYYYKTDPEFIRKARTPVTLVMG